MSVLYGKLTNGMAAIARINKIIGSTPKIPLHAGIMLPKVEGVMQSDRHVLKHLGRISFKNIEFSYPSRPNNLIFDKLNLDIKSGEVVALVGPSGSGKVFRLET